METRSRSLEAIAHLESLQAGEKDVLGSPPQLVHDTGVLREIAHRQLMAERLDSRNSTSHQEMTTSLIDLVGEPGYEAAVEARTRALERHYLGDDGDLWSRYERPDHRKRLSELVSMVERASAKCGYAIPQRPTVGTLPTRDINAQAIPFADDKGHIVAFETGMFNFSSAVASVFAQALDARFSDNGGSMQVLGFAEVGRHIATIPGILMQFADVLFSQAVLGTCTYVTGYPVPPPNKPWAERFRDGMDVFVLGHEYGHVILGHVDVHQLHDRSVEVAARQEELDADRIGFDVAATACYGAVWAAVGATLFLAVCDLVDRASTVFATGVDKIPESSTHPTGMQRRAALHALLHERFASSDALIAERVSETVVAVGDRLWSFVRPAFEHAHREGYPPRGFAVHSEHEKMAALHAFMAAGFAR